MKACLDEETYNGTEESDEDIRREMLSDRVLDRWRDNCIKDGSPKAMRRLPLIERLRNNRGF